MEKGLKLKKGDGNEGERRTEREECGEGDKEGDGG